LHKKSDAKEQVDELWCWKGCFYLKCGWKHWSII